MSEIENEGEDGYDSESESETKGWVMGTQTYCLQEFRFQNLTLITIQNVLFTAYTDQR